MEGFYRQEWGGTRKLLAKGKRNILVKVAFTQGEMQGSYHGDCLTSADQEIPH